MTVWHIAKIGATKQPTFALQKHLRLFGQECFLPSGRCLAKKQNHEKTTIAYPTTAAPSSLLQER